MSVVAKGNESSPLRKSVPEKAVAEEVPAREVGEGSLLAKPEIVMQSPGDLVPYDRNARKHSKKQIRQLANSMKRFGFTNPVLVADGQRKILAGHGRVEAAKLLKLDKVPTLDLSHLSVDEQRAYVLADNKLAENAEWDKELLALELGALASAEFDLEVIGFETVEIDNIFELADEASTKARERADEIPASGPAVARIGEIWNLGRHKLVCGDILNAGTLTDLMAGEPAAMVFTDPPYNVPIDGHVCGSGEIRHREFAYASGEMSSEEFTQFLEAAFRNMAAVLRDGCIVFVCMDWRHVGEINAAGRTVFVDLKNVIVWNKNNAGQGSFYRSKYELIFVFKNGSAAHINNFGLGETGRYRTNVWDYAGISSISATRQSELAMHPTVKPVALVADAIRDCSKRGDIILDAFGGSGTTLIAAQTTGRVARLAEIDPLYCDTIIRRWQKFSGQQATLASTGESFEQVGELRGLAAAESEDH